MILGRVRATGAVALLAAGLAVTLGGCATGGTGASQPSRNADGSLVLSGVFAGNAPAKGSVRQAGGGATFTAEGGAGLSCTGTFQLHGEMTQFVPFTCSNGRNGQAVVTLGDNRESGSIVLVYDSGPQRDYARFAFGSLPFSEAFEANPRG